MFFNSHGNFKVHVPVWIVIVCLCGKLTAYIPHTLKTSQIYYHLFLHSLTLSLTPSFSHVEDEQDGRS